MHFKSFYLTIPHSFVSLPWSSNPRLLWHWSSTPCVSSFPASFLWLIGLSVTLLRWFVLFLRGNSIPKQLLSGIILEHHQILFFNCSVNANCWYFPVMASFKNLSSLTKGGWVPSCPAWFWVGCNRTKSNPGNCTASLHSQTTFRKYNYNYML